ncbi:L-lactate dehydrogenase [Sphingobium lactosutens]|uniref:L-lactate dehydrogenase n=1 Tax=Sphingobium lactosutens TaxID=522773 RepID=UPI0015BD53F7|nr:L-lactate dehydrogenase [Sphingobium lactosutens]NWK99141.1 L-lactate dehydrogenase [Sphingobium lactosutens]
MSIATAADFRAIARSRLPHFLFEYFDGAAFDGRTARRNIEDLGAVELRQWALRDVSAIDTATRFLGQDWSIPLALSPVGLAGMAARRGEVMAARAARAAKVGFTLSSTSICPLDEVSVGGACWFQLYMVRDRRFVEDMVSRARAIGSPALVLTVDVPILGPRWRDAHSGLYHPGLTGQVRRLTQAMVRPRWAVNVGLFGRPHSLGNVVRYLGPGTGMTGCMAWTQANMDASVDWDALSWVRSLWDGPLIVKGILEPDDARRAVEHGADALVVSNHGGRQLDGVASTAQALPSIAAALEGKVPLLVDGGVRTGLDIVRMIALGADAVMAGRPWLYALAAAGEVGVRRMIALLETEMRIAMALTGCTKVADIGPGIINRR